VEIRDDKADVVTPIGALKRAKINPNLEGMVPVFDVLGGSRKVDEVLAAQPESKVPYLITGAAGTGKTTLIKALNNRGMNAIDGDTFGQAIRSGPKGHMEVFVRWAMSELDEMIRAKDLREVSDGVFDIFGLAALGLPLVPTGFHSAAREYIRSQEERDRPRHFFYDLIEHLGEDASAYREAWKAADAVFRDRYNDTDTKEPSVWDMEWDVDVDAIEGLLLSGTSVGVTGSNRRDIYEMAGNLVTQGKIRWVHLVCGPGTTRTRLTERAVKWHESGDYPHGIKDVPMLKITNEVVTDVIQTTVRGAKIYGNIGGKFTPEGLNRLWA
jgi:energy-coupling factor transporter ATP-binding protein EcfA2